jgi:hypothetical protein
MKNYLSIMILLVILLAFNAESWSQTHKYYKYVDEKGVTHFTNVPADPRYNPASKSINRKAPKKPKALKPRSHSKSTPPPNVNRLNNPPGHSN